MRQETHKPKWLQHASVWLLRAYLLLMIIVCIPISAADGVWAMLKRAGSEWKDIGSMTMPDQWGIKLPLDGVWIWVSDSDQNPMTWPSFDAALQAAKTTWSIAWQRGNLRIEKLPED